MRSDPFKGFRFSPRIILQEVTWYCRYGLSYRDVQDLLAEQGVEVSASSIFRWVQRFGPELAHRVRSQRNWRGLNWHADETYIRVAGKWRYLWRAIDQFGLLIDFRLTARRDARVARAFLKQAIESAGLYYPDNITTDKARNYQKIIREINRWIELPDRIQHIDHKYLNNRIESDHAALKKLIKPMHGFKSLECAKATLKGIEAIRTIRKGGVYNGPVGSKEEQGFINTLFGVTD